MASHDEPATKKIYCNICKTSTNHTLKCSHRDAVSDEAGLWEEFLYSLWVCAGCDTGTLEQRYTSVDSLYPNSGDQVFEREYYPKRKRYDLTPKRFTKLAAKLSQKPVSAIRWSLPRSLGYAHGLLTLKL
jgi:hypothetical protein